MLHPSGDVVDVILDGVDVSFSPMYGLSGDPSTADPPSYGYPVMVNETYFSIGLEEWVSRMYITRDTEAIWNAIDAGGTIIMHPGVYNWNARTVYSKIVGSTELFQYTSMMQYDRDFVPWGTPLDYHLKGATTGKDGPLVKVVCDLFIHIGADPAMITHPIHILENIHFDNSEWEEHCISMGGFSFNTILGWVGLADLTINKCKFTGGGVTLHSFGSATFTGNVMDQTLYGVQVTPPADADFLIANNKIHSAGAGIWCEQLVSFWYDSRPKTIEITGNEIAWSDLAGVGIFLSDASIIAQHNTVTSVPALLGNYFGYYAGIGTWGCLQGGLIKNNHIVGGEGLENFYGISLGGTNASTIQSNNVSGMWFVPISLGWELDFGTGPSNSNVLVGNNLNNVVPISGAHYFLDWCDYNVIRGGGIGGQSITVVDNGVGNLATGLDHQIGQLSMEEPYTSMKHAMSEKFSALKEGP
ncbi:MAG: hypothetical protein AB3N63_07565 [Puniceicoccaceae bacterium]